MVSASQLFLSTTPSTQLPPHSLVNCLHDIKAWMTSNQLKLNSNKTELMVVAPKALLWKVGDLVLDVDRTSICRRGRNRPFAHITVIIVSFKRASQTQTQKSEGQHSGRIASHSWTNIWTKTGGMTLQPTSFPADLSTPAPHGGLNSTNDTGCADTDVWEWLYSWQPVYIALITVLGIIFNVFVLMVFCLHKKACTVAEIYLSNLAAADLILMCCLPFWAVNISNGFHWPFGLFLCKVVSLGIKMNAYCSIYFLVLVGIDRYVALVHTMSHGRMRRPKYAKLSCLLVWGFGLLLCVPTLVFRRVQHFPEYNVHACFLDYPKHIPYLQLLFDVMLVIFGFIIPISIITYCTVRIIHALKMQSIERFNAEKTEQKATTLVLAVLLAFLICWVPFHIVATVDVLARAIGLVGCFLETVLDICNQIFTYLAFSNSVLNPILYVIVGKNFRKKVRELLKQWNIKKPVTSDSTRSNQSSTLKTLA
ncbi:B2 bradykinin receptor-like [Cheilinus undulatus]|uniref:B2 bradykinin receptor-like n=1 Tax=Cheilinus undulatus TaxID=241271 RepID=UPI001BD2ED11|nr:B2 bradykinin receptor-like [Cheilinus undulatus]